MGTTPGVFYTVKLPWPIMPTDLEAECTCPDFENRGGICKHAAAVLLALVPGCDYQLPKPPAAAAPAGENSGLLGRPESAPPPFLPPPAFPPSSDPFAAPQLPVAPAFSAPPEVPAAAAEAPPWPELRAPVKRRTLPDTFFLGPGAFTNGGGGGGGGRGGGARRRPPRGAEGGPYAFGFLEEGPPPEFGEPAAKRPRPGGAAADLQPEEQPAISAAAKAWDEMEARLLAAAPNFSLDALRGGAAGAEAARPAASASGATGSVPLWGDSRPTQARTAGPSSVSGTEQLSPMYAVGRAAAAAETWTSADPTPSSAPAAMPPAPAAQPPASAEQMWTSPRLAEHLLGDDDDDDWLPSAPPSAPLSAPPSAPPTETLPASREVPPSAEGPSASSKWDSSQGLREGSRNAFSQSFRPSGSGEAALDLTEGGAVGSSSAPRPRDARPFPPLFSESQRPTRAAGFWEIQLDGGWTAFDREVAGLIATAEASGQSKLEYKARGQSYVIDLVSRYQVNVKSGVRRSLRRVDIKDEPVTTPPPSSSPMSAEVFAPPRPAASPWEPPSPSPPASALSQPSAAVSAAAFRAAPGALAASAPVAAAEAAPRATRPRAWEIQLDTGWQRYDEDVAALIAHAEEQGDAKVSYKARGQEYDIDLLGSFQVNTKTGVRRAVRPVLSPSSPAAAAARPSPPRAVPPPASSPPLAAAAAPGGVFPPSRAVGGAGSSPGFAFGGGDGADDFSRRRAPAAASPPITAYGATAATCTVPPSAPSAAPAEAAYGGAAAGLSAGSRYGETASPSAPSAAPPAAAFGASAAVPGAGDLGVPKPAPAVLATPSPTPTPREEASSGAVKSFFDMLMDLDD